MIIILKKTGHTCSKMLETVILAMHINPSVREEDLNMDPSTLHCKACKLATNGSFYTAQCALGTVHCTPIELAKIFFNI